MDEGWCMFEDCGDFNCKYSDKYKSCDNIRCNPAEGDAFCNISIVEKIQRNSSSNKESTETTHNKDMLKFLHDNEDVIYEHVKGKFNCGFVSREMDIAIETVNFIVQKLQHI